MRNLFSVTGYLFLTCLFVFCLSHCRQTQTISQSEELSKLTMGERDSMRVARTLDSLLFICWSVEESKPGNFRGAAPFIVYRGGNENRKWKESCNYSFEEDRARVDKTCQRIRGEIPESSPYRIKSYIKDTESEGTWHVLEIILEKGGPKGKLYFAFLKLGDRFALGDIDT